MFGLGSLLTLPGLTALRNGHPQVHRVCLHCKFAGLHLIDLSHALHGFPAPIWLSTLAY